MASPLAHQTGFLYGLMMPVMLGVEVILQDRWEPPLAAEIIQRHRCTYTMGATPFLNDIVYMPNVGDFDLSSLRTFVSAGAPISSRYARSGAGAVYGSPGAGPSIASSTAAQSRTLRVTTCSWVSGPQNSPKLGARLERARVGLRPTSPQNAAGMRIDPPMSFAWPTGARPAATAAAEPPLEPPVE